MRQLAVDLSFTWLPFLLLSGVGSCCAAFDDASMAVRTRRTGEQVAGAWPGVRPHRVVICPNPPAHHRGCAIVASRSHPDAAWCWGVPGARAVFVRLTLALVVLSSDGFKLCVLRLQLGDQFQSLWTGQPACRVEDAVGGWAVILRLDGGLPHMELDADGWSLCHVVALRLPFFDQWPDQHKDQNREEAISAHADDSRNRVDQHDAEEQGQNEE
jgi:hypothetical protein